MEKFVLQLNDAGVFVKNEMTEEKINYMKTEITDNMFIDPTEDDPFPDDIKPEFQKYFEDHYEGCSDPKKAFSYSYTVALAICNMWPSSNGYVTPYQIK